MKAHIIPTLKINTTNNDHEKYVRIEFMALIVYLNLPIIVHRTFWKEETITDIEIYPLVKFVWIKDWKDKIPF